MKIVLLSLLCVTAGGLSAAAEAPVGQAPKFDEKAILFGAATAHGRIGIDKPKSVYRLHGPIRLAVFYDHHAESPLVWPYGHDAGFLTCPDGSTTQFPIDTRIDILGPPDLIWFNPGGYGIGYHLEGLIDKPGRYQLRWEFGDMKSPTITFQVARRPVRQGWWPTKRA